MPQQSEFERLFLLEFFVDHVIIQNSSFDNRQSTLCLSFQFLHYPVMRVCEEDFNPPSMKQVTKESKIVFKSGKSCLFSVHPDQNNRIPSQFNLVMAVCQKSKFKDPPEKVLIGEAVVSLGSSFLNLLQPSDLSSIPTSGVKRDAFPLKDKNGKSIGMLAAFARLSCFGKLIVTQMLVGNDTEQFCLFKGTEQDRLFKDDGEMPIFETDESLVEEISKDTPYEEIFGFPNESEMEAPQGKGMGISPQGESKVVEEGEEILIKTEDLTVKPSEGKSVGEEVCDVDEEENFKEIGAEVNGNFIMIRVLKKKKKQKSDICDNEDQMSPCCCPPEPPTCPYAPKLNVCSCDYPLPPELVPTCPPQCCQSLPNYPPPNCSPVKNKGKSYSSRGKRDRLSVTNCPKEDCPLNPNNNLNTNQQEGDGGLIAMKGDQVYFQGSNKPGEPMNEKEKRIADSLYYRSDCNRNNMQQNTDQVIDRTNLNCIDSASVSNGNCTENKTPKRCDQKSRQSNDRKKKKST